MAQRTKRGCLISLAILLVLIGTAVGFAIFQAKRTPRGNPEYVALGSSFAAGAGLGPLEKRSPLLCARSINGYPQQLARIARLSIVDMSCGGAVTRHLLKGGQFFQGAQLRVIGPQTRLVTITVGGNDVGYIGDLSLLAARHSDTVFGWLVRRVWSGPKGLEARDWAKLESNLLATIHEVRQRAPKARIVVATYPTILPKAGTCDAIVLSPAEASFMRQVGNQLAATTRAAAIRGKATLVDMHQLGAGHDACSKSPWTNGYSGVAPFHPTLAGARATAEAIARELKRSPAGIAAVR